MNFTPDNILSLSSCLYISLDSSDVELLLSFDVHSGIPILLFHVDVSFFLLKYLNNFFFKILQLNENVSVLSISWNMECCFSLSRLVHSSSSGNFFFLYIYIKCLHMFFTHTGFDLPLNWIILMLSHIGLFFSDLLVPF